MNKSLPWLALARYKSWEQRQRIYAKQNLSFERQAEIRELKQKKNAKGRKGANKNNLHHKPFKKTLYDLQHGLCYLCAKNLIEIWTRDHVIPSLHGGMSRRNILLTHERCNSNKGNRMPFACEVFYCEIIYERVGK